MKNTIRVHHNGGKKSRPSQVQSRRAQAGADNVRIIIHEPGGGLFADFEIPQSFHDAMRRDAEAKGISLGQWIERSVRERIESVSTKNAASQTKTVTTKFGPQFALPADAPNACCLAIVNREDGYMSRIPLAENEFEGLWKKSILPGALPLTEFIAAAIRKAESERDDDYFLLENSVVANNALIELMFDHMQLKTCAGQSSGLDEPNSNGQTLVAGIQLLIQQCRRNLNKAATLDGTGKAVADKFYLTSEVKVAS